MRIFRNNKNLTYKQVNNKRNALAFLLFFCIALFSACVSGGLGVSNNKEIASSLLESSYINALTQDVHQYAADLCDEAGLPRKVADDGVTYNKIYELEKSYIYTSLNETEEYNKNAFLANVLHLKDDVTNSLKTALQENEVPITPEMEKEIDEFSTDISNYAKQRVRFENEDLYVKMLHTAKNVNIALIVITVVASILIVLRLLSIGNKKYRSLRYAVYAFGGAAVYNFTTSVLFRIIERNKGDVIYPSYLQAAIDNYTDICFYNFLMLTVIISFIAVCISAVVWILKKENL